MTRFVRLVKLVMLKVKMDIFVDKQENLINFQLYKPNHRHSRLDRESTNTWILGSSPRMTLCGVEKINLRNQNTAETMKVRVSA